MEIAWCWQGHQQPWTASSKWAKKPAGPYLQDRGHQPAKFKLADEPRRYGEMEVRRKGPLGDVSLHPLSPSMCHSAVFQPYFPSSIARHPIVLLPCPEQSSGPAKWSLHLDKLFTQLGMGKHVLQPSAWLSASPWQSAASRCSVTFWGISQEISSWLNNESKNQFVERLESNENTN